MAGSENNQAPFKGSPPLMAAAASLAFAFPLALFMAYQQKHAGEDELARAEFHARSHLHMVEESLNRARETSAVAAQFLTARNESALVALAKMQGDGSRIEISRQGETLLVAHSGRSLQSYAPLPGEAHGQPQASGDAAIAVTPERIAVSQPLLLVTKGEKPSPWGHVTVVLPTRNLAASGHLGELSAEGYSARLLHLGTTGKTVLFESNPSATEPIASRSLLLPGYGNLQLEIHANTSSSLFAKGTLAWLFLGMGSALLYFLVLHLLRRPQILQREVALHTRLLDEEKQALQKEINSRIHAEGLLERSHRLLDTIFEHIPGMIVLKRAGDLRIARVNRSTEEVLGRNRDSLLGRCNEEIYPPELAARLSNSDYQTMLDGGLVDLSLERIEMPGQAERWVRFRKIALSDGNGRPEYILEFGEDVSERERLDLRLREHLNFLEQLIDAIPGPLFFKDTRGRYLGVNRAFETYMGISRSEISGKTVFDIAPQALAFNYQRADSELLEAGGSQIYESRARRCDGVERHVMFHKAVYHATNGAAGGIVGIMLDITERKEAEEQIRQLNRTLTVISHANQAIVRLQEREALLTTVANLMSEQGEFPVSWASLNLPGKEILVVTPTEHRDLAARLANQFAHPAPHQAISAQYLSADALEDETLRHELSRLGLQAVIHLPLTVQGRLLGSLGILATNLDLFAPEERRMLGELSDNVSFALETFAIEESRRAAEEKLQLSARVFDNSSEGITITDEKNCILMVNKAFTQVTGYQPEEVIGKNPSVLKSGRQDATFYAEMWESLLKTGEWRGEIENRRKDGEVYPERLSLSVVRGTDGKITNFVAVFSDLTKRKEIEKQLNFLAHYDNLTALPNRVLFHQQLEQIIAKARKKRSMAAILVLDIDRFKLINDTMGHMAGDRLLQEVSSRLTAHLSMGDSVGRLGGDEFAIILSELQSANDAASRAAEIQHVLRQGIRLEEHEFHLSVSIGISLFPNDGDTVETLMANADSAMYSAIESGGNAFRFFQQEMNSHSAERMRLEGKLHHALERNELAVYFQPLVSAQSGRIIGAEALLRWFDKETGNFIPPSTFVPLLEETGLIVPVGEWVMRTACSENRRWRRATGRDLFVAVNLSALQLADVRLVDKVSEILGDTDMPPRCLEIELTESAVMRDADHGIRTLQRLKELGVSLSIDDFGTGYSSLSYLKQLPLDTLKIDRSFVIDAPADDEAVSIIQAIVAMGHSLHLEIIAEGVETPQQVSFLRHAGVEILQGYYFSKALAPDTFLSLVDEAPGFSLGADTTLASAQPIPLRAAAIGKAG